MCLSIWKTADDPESNAYSLPLDEEATGVLGLTPAPVPPLPRHVIATGTRQKGPFTTAGSYIIALQ